MSTDDLPIELNEALKKLDHSKVDIDNELKELQSSFSSQINKLKKEVGELKAIHEQNIMNLPNKSHSSFQT